MEIKPQDLRATIQLQAYFSCRTDRLSQGADEFKQSWKNLKTYAFTPFSLVGRVLKKVQKEHASLLLIVSAWQPQAWYPCMSQMSIKNPILLSKWPNILKNPAGENHSLVQNNSLQLVA